MDARGGQCAEERREERGEDFGHTQTHTHLYVSLQVHKRQTERLGSAVSTPRRLVFGTPRGSPRPFHRQLLPLALLRTPHCALARVLLVGVCCSGGRRGLGRLQSPLAGLWVLPALELEKPKVCAKCVSQRRRAGAAGATPLGPALPWSGAGIYRARPDCSLEDT